MPEAYTEDDWPGTVTTSPWSRWAKPGLAPLGSRNIGTRSSLPAQNELHAAFIARMNGISTVLADTGYVFNRTAYENCRSDL